MSGSASTRDSAAHRREQGALHAATLTNGPNEFVDFVLPLFAGVALGASATEVGMLAALEMLVSVLFRPWAGVLADTRDRRYIAATGALLYAVSCAGYAFSTGMATAYLAAAIGGAGGALLWVSVRAILGERLAEDSTVFPRLLAAQETGAWIFFVAGIGLLSVIDFVGVFLACALACLLGAAALASSPPRTRTGRDEAATGPDLRGVATRLRPMLFAVVITMTAEAMVGLLVLLHLQRGFDLEIAEIALVFLPGAIAMGVLPPYLHGLVRRFGRTMVLISGSVASSLFALGLAAAPHPIVIAGIGILSGVAWAAILPIQQAVIVEAVPDRTGRAMGLYESASLVGGLIGSLAAGLLYDTNSWTTACIVAAVVIGSGAVIVPKALRSLAAAEHPVETPPAMPTQSPDPSPGPVSGQPEPAATDIDGDSTAVVDDPPEQATEDDAEPTRPPKTARRHLADLGGHALLFGGVQAILIWLDLSWAFDLVTLQINDLILQGGVQHDGVAAFVYGAARFWTLVFVVDALWTVWQVISARRAARG